MQPYVYEPLPTAQSIRLLKLHHEDSKGPTRDLPIRCSLRIVSLAECQAYSAISYTWGETSLTRVIECDGRGIEIMGNSFHVLQDTYRSEYRDVELWIDAVCINQSCLDERAHQVRLMRSIYSKAAMTFVFLGEPKEQGNLALKLAQQVIDMTTKIKPGNRITKSNLEEYGLPPIENPGWKALFDLSSQPWFSRVWIMQEYILSNKILMVYGGIWTPSEFYVSISETLYEPRNNGYGLALVLSGLREADREEEIKDLNYSPWTAGLASNFGWMDVTRQLFQGGLTLKRREWILSTIFRRASIRHATDPRDQIYGVLGLIDESETNHPDLLPDYHLPVSETYIRAARYLLNKKDLAFLLDIVGFPKFIDSLPSWVPDWSARKFVSTIDLNHVKSEFSAGENMKAVWRLNPGQAPDELIVRGTILDVVVEIESILQGSRLWKEANVKFFFRTAELVKRSAMAATRSDLGESHIRTLTFGQSSANLTFSEHSSFSQIPEPLYHNDQRFRATLEEKQRISKFIGRIEAGSSLLNFCLTKLGSIGRIPPQARIGDKVCFFRGIAKPFIIRNHEERANKYILIGSCYIHGKMHGEAFQGKDLEIQEISLI